MNIEDIQNAIDVIEEDLSNIRDYLDLLRSSSTIPIDIENALRERLAFLSSTGITGSASTQSVSVPSTPTNITVPAQPSGTVAVQIGNATYNLLYK